MAVAGSQASIPGVLRDDVAETWCETGVVRHDGGMKRSTAVGRCIRTSSLASLRFGSAASARSRMIALSRHVGQMSALLAGC